MMGWCEKDLKSSDTSLLSDWYELALATFKVDVLIAS